MIREFTLDEITFEEFDRLFRIVGISPDTSNVSRRRGKTTKIKKYFTFSDHIRYSFEELLNEINDGVQQPKLVWFPNERLMGEAGSQTRQHFEEYGKELCEKEPEQDTVLIELAKGGIMDQFEFHKQEGLWVQRYMHIRGRNFSRYTFNGIGYLDPFTIHSISGIHIQ